MDIQSSRAAKSAGLQMYMTLIEQLQSILPAERLKTSLVDRLAWAGDAGFYALTPQAVALPELEAEVQQLFALAHQHRVPLVFRAGGTSLSGQSITDGILVDISRYWRKSKVLQGGRVVEVQPGIIGGQVNQLLKPHGKKIGPDPASINAAMMGGILANNASGMCCGVAYNAYHTLESVRFMLPNGVVFDTSIPEDYLRFENEEAALHAHLLHIRAQVLGNAPLLEKIRSKYRMKNTVGYSLNALVDYEHPLDILAHLLIGSEGTLAFISKARLHTLPDLPFKSASMLYFPDMQAACSAIGLLKESGAEALELMDRSALRSVEHLKGLPAFFSQLPAGAAALLCEYQSDTADDLARLLSKATTVCADLPLLHPPAFTQKEADRMFYWKIRKGMFPSVGAVRSRGTTVILEDVAFPVARLAEAVSDLQALFTEYKYDNAIIFGHAKEGNIHFVITQLLDTQAEVQRYDTFMRRVVELVVRKYQGALKAEHGTGRNMAPFVETEWGGEAYALMRSIKQLIDPQNVLNPGVIINADAEAHIKDLKQMPQVEEEVDKCIECGFCEHHCPSRDVTLSPRQRIQVRRQLQLLKQQGKHMDYNALLQQYQYAGLDTCATDGLCQVDCPVEINTGELVKRLRREQHGTLANKVALQVAHQFWAAEALVKAALHAGTFANRILGKNFMANLTRLLQKALPAMPRWWPELGRPPARMQHVPVEPRFVYMSACIQRMMGSHAHKGSVQSALLAVCERAGVPVLLPPNLSGHCCGQAFGSKGYQQAAVAMQQKTIDALWNWSKEGKLPIVCDFTSCTYTLLQAGSQLSAQARERWSCLTIMDSITFLEKEIMPRLNITQPKQKVVIHPGCAATKLLLTGAMQHTAQACAKEVVLPAAAGCCGMAGDRGFLFPELTEGATAAELAEAAASGAEGYYASAKTCEMALSHFSGKPYEHIVYLLEEASRPVEA